MPARTLYVGQTVAIYTNGGSGVGAQRLLPVQSASCEVNRPIEDILSFGRLGSLGRVQTAVSTCKSDIKTYIPFTTGTGGPVGDPSRVNLVDSLFIQQLTGEALNGLPATIQVFPNGFTMSGILTNIGVEIANGSFATSSMSFAGVGEPFFDQPGTGASFTQSPFMPASFTPVVSSFVSGAINTGCATSFKFSLDIPNETVSCLGGKVTGTQVQVAPNFLMVAKPPFKASITLEGTAVAPDATGSALFTVGRLTMQLPAGQVTSRSFNNAVGNVGATYNYTIEDVSALFSDFGTTYP